MDAYIEENREHSHAYMSETNVTYQNACGFKMISFLKEKYDLPVSIEVGWSPTDTERILLSALNLESPKPVLDYVFIDALHTTDAVLADIKLSLIHI